MVPSCYEMTSASYELDIAYGDLRQQSRIVTITIKGHIYIASSISIIEF